MRPGSKEDFDKVYEVSEKGCMLREHSVSYFSNDIILERMDIRNLSTNELLISVLKLSGTGLDDKYWVE